MSVVSSELWIRAFERRVSVGLWLLDPFENSCVSSTFSVQPKLPSLFALPNMCSSSQLRYGGGIPVLVRLLRLVVLRRVL